MSNTRLVCRLARSVQSEYLPDAVAIRTAIYLVPIKYFLSGLLFDARSGGDRKVTAFACCLASPFDVKPLTVIYNFGSQIHMNDMIHVNSQNFDSCRQLTREFLAGGAEKWMHEIVDPDRYMLGLKSESLSAEVYRHFQESICHKLSHREAMARMSVESAKQIAESSNYEYDIAYWNEVKHLSQSLNSETGEYWSDLNRIVYCNLRKWNLVELEPYLELRT